MLIYAIFNLILIYGVHTPDKLGEENSPKNKGRKSSKKQWRKNPPKEQGELE